MFVAQRYGVDTEHAARVEATALALFDQVAPGWGLDGDEERMLGWAARIHELGLTIAHSQHHVHGAYLIEHSDMAGFSRQEQQLLAAMVRCQRRSVSSSTLGALPERLVQNATSPFFDQAGSGIFRIDRIAWLRKAFDLACDEYARLDLDEVPDRDRAGPDVVVEPAVDPGRNLDADGRDALAIRTDRRVLREDRRGQPGEGKHQPESSTHTDFTWV